MSVNLGRVALVPKGAYDAAAMYEYLDVVSEKNGSYVYVSPVPAAGKAVNDTAFWQPLADPSDMNAAVLSVQQMLDSIPADYVEMAEQVRLVTKEVAAAAAYGMKADAEWELGSLLSESGAETATRVNRIRTAFLPVCDVLVMADWGMKFALHYYDSEKRYLKDAYVPFQEGTAVVSAQAPDNAAFYRVVAARKDEAELTEIAAETAGRMQLMLPNRSYADELHRMATAYTESCMPQTDMMLVTEFSYLPGRWNLVGAIGTTGFHSQMIPVEEGKMYYIGYRGESSACSGAFLDSDGKWLTELRRSETQIHEYTNADGNKERTDYARIYAFVVPAGARYVSLNLTDDAEYKYRQFLSTKPVFALKDTGVYKVQEGDPAYQAKKNKSLCVIGASGVVIDRLKPSGFGEYIVGFQEYLAPWYKHVGSYGFWSGSWARYNVHDPSIYSGIVDAGVDLSGYDEFLLIPSTADVEETGIGEIDSTDPGNYMGGLNGVIAYIYDQVPHAKVYLANVVHKGKYFTTPATRERMDEINEKLRQLSQYKSYPLIDLVSGMGINDRNYQLLTYDGTHLNQEGNRLQGLFMRKEMIGF